MTRLRCPALPCAANPSRAGPTLVGPAGSLFRRERTGPPERRKKVKEKRINLNLELRAALFEHTVCMFAAARVVFQTPQKSKNPFWQCVILQTRLRGTRAPVIFPETLPPLRNPCSARTGSLGWSGRVARHARRARRFDSSAFSFTAWRHRLHVKNKIKRSPFASTFANRVEWAQGRGALLVCARRAQA